MEREPLNPYQPPSGEDTQNAPLKKEPGRNILLEIIEAFFTIIGIMLGWSISGIGIWEDRWAIIMFGVMIIFFSCLLGMGFHARLKKHLK